MRFHALITPVLAALLLTGCAGSVPARPAGPAPGSPAPPTGGPTPPVPSAPPGLLGSWRAVELSPGGLVTGHEPRLVLEADRLGMRPGCNTGGGAYSVEGDQLRVEGLMSTKMACAEPVMAQEQTVAALLEADPRWSVEGDRLLLVAGERRMVLERDTSAPGPEPSPGPPATGPTLTPAPGQR